MDCKLPKTSVLVIGAGNRFRGDDAAGPIAADDIRSRAPRGVRVIEHSGEGASLMETWRPGDIVFLIDAADSGGEPGFIHEFEACDRAVPSEFLRYSTHAFSVAEAIELARVLGRLPARLHIFAIEGRDFGAGRTISPEVVDAVEIVSKGILTRISKMANGADTENARCMNSVS
jgi:hydrogenase maturation protease